LPSTLDCASATAYTSAPNATYTNGATGACENSGTIPATITPNWTLCAGGTITINYIGVDDCGNALTGSATIAVTLYHLQHLLYLHCLQRLIALQLLLILLPGCNLYQW
jgi:hypothetical protein